ncbi:MAG: hypothetical protein FWB96_07400 [Defluviitaleaceae bacterium]|nr:hypothetical protein [Defluviitaleaceae bacterium]MCL2262632.1 hypothetical protein [Defluviitaleaceae bacterium]
MKSPAKKLLFCIGEINDLFLEEAETFAPEKTSRKRIAKYGALAAAAAFGIAVTYKFIRTKQVAKSA